MKLDRNRPYGTLYGVPGAAFAQDGLNFDGRGELVPGQDVPEESPPVVEEAPRLAPEPKYDDPGYAPDKKPTVYLTQMNMRQLRAECVDLDVPFTPGDKKKALVAKIREARASA